MDHRIIEIDAKAVLLDRLEDDDNGQWQVMISTFVAADYRFDEWVKFEEAESAQAYITDYSERAAARFLKRASVKHAQVMTR